MYSAKDLNRYIDSVIKENRTIISDELSGFIIHQIQKSKDLVELHGLLANGIELDNYFMVLESIIMPKLDPTLGIYHDAKFFLCDYLTASFDNCCGNEAFITKEDLREIEYSISDRIEILNDEAEHKAECLTKEDEE